MLPVQQQTVKHGRALVGCLLLLLLLLLLGKVRGLAAPSQLRQVPQTQQQQQQ